MMEGNNKKKKRQSNTEKPISLKPLKFDEAVSDLLKVKPESKKLKKETTNTDTNQNSGDNNARP